ncbi:uncharacterized protein LOC126687691 [Mercurialis annua]|uniref:uncharacterized protein LOC126687691 n=1 Tax=Mercurialis annua TaxID=3986 RepID=UPI00215E3430|nr:uncharacterized protein LOC126687691 [Mercurialis annua]
MEESSEFCLERYKSFRSKQCEYSGNARSSNFQSGNNYQPNQGNFNSNNYGSRPQNPPGFQSNRNQNEGSKLDKILEKFEKFEAEARQKDKNQAAAFHHLEVQISQLATYIQGRNQGGLPSTTETNPKEQVKAVELRIQKALNDPHGKKPIEVYDELNVDEAISSNTKESEEVIVEDATLEVRPPPPPPYVPKVPFPSRLRKTPDNHKFHKFLEIFKKLQINISLADALREMPQYAKFPKDIIMNKRSWEDKGSISLTKNCSSIILSDLPTKLKDPGSFTIPCTIGNLDDVSCLCDLGESINLRPLFLFRNLFGNQSVKQTSMVLQLADQSIKKPYGVVEDVLVKVDKFIFPVDFVILDYAVDKNCPMILRRPFMNTRRALIDVHAGNLTLRIDEDSLEFDMKRLMRNATKEEGWDKVTEQLTVPNSLHVSSEICKSEEGIESAQVLEVSFISEEPTEQDKGEDPKEDESTPDELIRNERVTPPSSVKTPKVELKLLPSHLSPSVVMHKIHLEDESKSSA